MEERLEREKQKRIEHTQQMALRRIGKRELFARLGGVGRMYLERKRRKRTLVAAGRGC